MTELKNGKSWLIILLPVIGFLVGLIFQSIIFSHQPLVMATADLDKRVTVLEMTIVPEVKAIQKQIDDAVLLQLKDVNAKLDLLLEEP